MLHGRRCAWAGLASAAAFLTRMDSCLLLIPCATAFGWGAGHDTVARETLRVLPGVWGERLRAGEEGKLFLRTCHAPDDQSTKLADRSEYLDAEFRAAMDQGNGRPPVMYRLHAADARCEMIRAMARAMKRDDLKSVAFLLACFNHSVADTVSANHSPLIQLVTYNWRVLGLSGTVEDDCAVLEKTEEGKAIMRKTVDAAVQPLRKKSSGGKGVDAAAVWAACYADELNGRNFYRFDVDLAHVLRRPERDDAGNRNVEAKVQQLLRKPRRAGKTMDDSARGNFAQQTQRIVIGLPRMNDDRQLKSPREFQLPGEERPLRSRRLGTIMVIETDFPHRRDPGVIEFGKFAPELIAIPADRPQRKALGTAIERFTATDREDLRYSGRTRARDRRLNRRGRTFEMRMGIEEFEHRLQAAGQTSRSVKKQSTISGGRKRSHWR